MILGRPTNLWLGLTTAVIAAVQVTLITLGYDAVAVGTILGAAGAVVGALILLVANQPPTVNPGSQVNVTTPSGQDTATGTLGVTPGGDVTVRP